MKRFLSKYIGLILAVLYGLLFRVVFDENIFNVVSVVNLYSITFVFVVPFFIGIVPMLFATHKQLQSKWYSLGMPVLAILLFFAACIYTELEGMLCIVIIFLPYFAFAMIGAAMVRSKLLRLKEDDNDKKVYSVLLLPLLIGIIEQRIEPPMQDYNIDTSIIINANDSLVWENIVRVDEIKEEEYNEGFFYYAGVPRPLYAELDKDTLHGKRIGHFSNGLAFREEVTEWVRFEQISFDINVVDSSLSESVFDKHVLSGEHFKFLNAKYKIEKINDNKVKLTLSSSYQLQTTVNTYGAFWGGVLVTDFQKRLLTVIKNRCEAS